MYHRRPPRLDDFFYQGFQRIFLTMCTFERRTWFSERSITLASIDQLLQTAAAYYDHVLRDEEDGMAVAHYIIANPVRAGLCDDVRAYPYSGSSKYSIEELAQTVTLG